MTKKVIERRNNKSKKTEKTDYTETLSHGIQRRSGIVTATGLFLFHNNLLSKINFDFR